MKPRTVRWPIEVDRLAEELAHELRFNTSDKKKKGVGGLLAELVLQEAKRLSKLKVTPSNAELIRQAQEAYDHLLKKGGR